MRLFLKIIALLLCLTCTAEQLSAQHIFTGTVFDSSKKNLVEGVRVESTGGNSTMTDSMGRFRIMAKENDSLSFIFRNKPTQKFPVKDIADPSRFDIALHVTVKGKYTTMKEVVVFSKSYREDSIENRRTYANAYDFRKPTIRTSISPDGNVGADVNEIINIFRFKRNKRLKAFQARLEKQEQEKYVNYRFNKTFVRRITHLEGAQLEEFMIRYVPSYEFASQADEITFNKYILAASYEYKIELLRQPVPKLSPEAKN
ncbi:MAG TPA: hypothetical protein VK489_14975 [Ferruginibacter sp.]|nr:hypothetical protein [Ferruginibacter sp.]